MPPRSLTGTVFGAAAALWGLLLGVLIALLAPAGGGPSAGFWVGVALLAGTGAAVGATGGHRLARGLPRRGRTGGVIRFAAGGVALLALAGGGALALGLLLTALTAGLGDTWGTLWQAAARPERLAWSVAGVALVGLPIGAAGGVVLRALAAPPSAALSGDSPGTSGSPSRPLR
jgi:hypothetical protein